MNKLLNQCLCCGNEKLYTVLDLGQQPPANSFHGPDVSLPYYDLKLMLCDQCWHTQLSTAVDPAELFRHYLYVSGTSQTLRDYFDWFAQRQGQPGAVLDIACNDGSQLNSFRRLGWTTVGVDPAENLAPSSRAGGHDIYVDFWTAEVADRVKQAHGRVDLIVAQNVFAHTADPGSFLDACRVVMDENSRLLIQTSQAHMFARNEFDTIYHEHISFFSYSSMCAIAERHGFTVVKAEYTDIHGTSHLFELQLGSRPKINTLDESYRYNREYYENFATKARGIVEDLAAVIASFKAEGRTVVGYGAAAKGMTVLNAGQISLDMIIDDSPLKQNLLTPGMNIPVKSSEHLLYLDHPVVFVPLAWNFFAEIKQKIKKLRPTYDDRFVLYFPCLEVQPAVDLSEYS